MPVPNTKILLGSTILSGGGFTLTPNAVGDFAPTLTGLSAPPWLASVGDLNGDGVADLAIGASGDDDRRADAGRIFVTMSNLAAGSSTNIATNSWIIDGVNAGDLAGFSVALNCLRQPASGSHEEQQSRVVGYVLTATASSGSGASADRVERQVQTTVIKCKNPTAGSAPDYAC